MYQGSCYIGIAGGAETIHFAAYASIMNMSRRDGDTVPQFIQGTKGYEVRQKHFDRFMESDHEFMLLLDGDMIFEEDTLERLRSHGLPYVSGLYMYRTMNMQQIWFEPFSGEWPYKPMVKPPERGKLQEIGASGWGCILIHRDVVKNTRQILKGELDVIEDDMDVWPYNQNELHDTIDILSKATELNDESYCTFGYGSEDVEQASLKIREIIRPLRGDKSSIVGSDVRYPFYALHAGYQLMGDPEVRPRHLLTYGLSPDDYEALPIDAINEKQYQINAQWEAERDRLLEVAI